MYARMHKTLSSSSRGRKTVVRISYPTAFFEVFFLLKKKFEIIIRNKLILVSVSLFFFFFLKK